VSALFAKICYSEIMKKLFLCILLSLIWCNVGFTEIDDVYYCEMDKSVKTTDKEVIQFKKKILNSKESKIF